VGFWGLGDQPAALFQAGGVVKRIHVGEAVGDSGWTLVSVAEQEAVIRRNGEVRSVFAGQTF
jgi:Tfp pilus assembly protein PilP